MANPDLCQGISTVRNGDGGTARIVRTCRRPIEQCPARQLGMVPGGHDINPNLDNSGKVNLANKDTEITHAACNAARDTLGL